MKIAATRQPTHAFELALDPHLQVSASHPLLLMRGRAVSLTPIEHHLLQTICRDRGQVLSPGILLAPAWPPHRVRTRCSLAYRRQPNRLVAPPLFGRLLAVVPRDPRPFFALPSAQADPC